MVDAWVVNGCVCIVYATVGLMTADGCCVSVSPDLLTVICEG